MHIDLIFPPVHDPAMPHSALPLLKAYIERNSSYTARCYDLNHSFYSLQVLPVSENGEGLPEFRHMFDEAATVAEGVTSSLRFDRWLKAGFATWAEQNAGYDVTFRNLGTPIDRRDPVALREYATSPDPTPFDVVFSEIVGNGGPIYGINLSVEDQIVPAFRLAGLIRKVNGKAARIVWGGSLLARIYPVIAEQLDDFWDYLVTREGEEPLMAILRELDGCEPLSNNEDRIISKSNVTDHELSITRPFASTSITDIDKTGNPNYDDYDLQTYYSLIPMLPVLASRKCYWGRCQFCTIHDSWDPAHRARTAEGVSSEIDRLVTNYGIKHFRFVDEAMPPDLIDSIIPLIEPHHVAFEIYAIAERRFRDQDFVRRLGAARCRQAYFGLESADEGALVAMGKKINQFRHYADIFGSCAEAGIHVYVYTLFGFPGSSDLAEQKTVDYISAEKSIHSATIGSFVPVSGSPFALENASRLRHSGRMTEDFENVIIGIRNNSLDEVGREAAASAVRSVYAIRPDLALTAVLNDEMRFCLSDKFGADFAHRALAEGAVDAAVVAREADETMTHERIDRSL